MSVPSQMSPSPGSLPPGGSSWVFSRSLGNVLALVGAFRYFFALAALVALVAALVAGVRITQVEQTVVARSSSGVLTLAATGQVRAGTPLTLYGTDASGQRVDSSRRCTLSTAGNATTRTPALYGPGSRPQRLGGKLLYPRTSLTGGWAVGDTVSCPGTAALVALHNTSRFPQVAMTGMLLLLSVGSAGMALLGYAHMRRRRAALG